MEVAEASKIVENVQRDIDIAFVNELSIVLPRMGVDVDEVLEAADTKWSFHRHYPGIGVGGHCIPVDPYYYLEASNNSGAPSRLVPIARKINEEMPVISASSILNSIEGGAEKKRALVLGYSYKPNIGDTRMTPVQKLAEKLNDEGMEVLVWDPHVESENIPSWIHHVEDPMGVFELEVVILATAHNECINLDWEKLLLNTPTRKIFDGRRAMKASEMESLGWRYSGVGFP